MAQHRTVIVTAVVAIVSFGAFVTAGCSKTDTGATTGTNPSTTATTTGTTTRPGSTTGTQPETTAPTTTSTTGDGSTTTSAPGAPTSITAAPSTTTVAVLTALPHRSTTTGSTPPRPTPTTKNITIVDYDFGPSTLIVNVGDSVVFTNTGDVDHWVLSNNKTTLDSKAFGKGQTYEHTFTTPGAVSYFCNIHNGMKGSITAT